MMMFTDDDDTVNHNLVCKTTKSCLTKVTEDEQNLVSPLAAH